MELLDPFILSLVEELRRFYPRVKYFSSRTAPGR